MVRVNINEIFPIAVTLIDETTGLPATGETVYYDVRKQPGDLALAPPLSGTLTESSIEPGIYSTLASVSESGSYIIYATCTGFISNTEELIVNPEDVIEVVKQNRHYNTSVEDVIRTSATPSASQIARKVGSGRTDYVITRIKPGSAADWSDPTTVSGSVYAHYRELDDDVPFMMGGPF